MAKKIKVTPTQLKDLEMLVVGYMWAAENKSGFSPDKVKIILLRIDSDWDARFEVVDD
ncbi:hypothetical protein S140_78 [Shewanella sp. phage 1/40]|uniref:hypothetical protein n=1 Tax=Shewanella sp. phage 1/40 TaxID=1458860 RepID=UPI0004F85D6A|nr:hypothetical protein S140_78 [Shewanella sp. phage 1/40]AHK11488.1 hypothetical protein S140_78 [Shewanella sp. phage 1/40]